jgi:hypothetical protein
MTLNSISENLIHNINNLIKNDNDFKLIFLEVDHYNDNKYLLNFFLNYYKNIKISKTYVFKYFNILSNNEIKLKNSYYKDINIKKNTKYKYFNKYLDTKFTDYYKEFIIKKSKNYIFL